MTMMMQGRTFLFPCFVIFLLINFTFFFRCFRSCLLFCYIIVYIFCLPPLTNERDNVACVSQCDGMNVLSYEVRVGEVVPTKTRDEISRISSSCDEGGRSMLLNVFSKPS